MECPQIISFSRASKFGCRSLYLARCAKITPTSGNLPEVRPSVTAYQRSGSGQRSGILLGQRFGSGRRTKIYLRFNTAILVVCTCLETCSRYLQQSWIPTQYGLCTGPFFHSPYPVWLISALATPSSTRPNPSNRPCKETKPKNRIKRMNMSPLPGHFFQISRKGGCLPPSASGDVSNLWTLRQNRQVSGCCAS